MKKNAAIVLAAFYLLLSTGMYVCTFSCGSELVIDLITFGTCKQHQHESKKMDCNGEEDCPCCKKHGNYTVKENIKPVINNQVPEIPLVTEILDSFSFQSNYLFGTLSVAWPNSNSPPPGGSTPVYIKIRSLLI